MPKRPGVRRFWLAQLFVVGVLAFIGLRFSESLHRGAEDAAALSKTRTGPVASARIAPPPARPLSGVRGEGSGPETRASFVPAIPPPKSGRNAPPAVPYVPQEYRTWLATDEDGYQAWNLDPRELSWLLAHKRQILTSELETRPEPEGGLRVLGIREGSFGSLRGLRVGDLLEEINGQTLDGPSDLEDLIADPAHSGARGWRVLLVREGRPLTIDYRPAPGSMTSTRNH